MVYKVTEQTVDTGAPRAHFEQHLVASGYWDTPERRRRNAYTLSPSVYCVSEKQRNNLDRLAQTLHQAVRTLNADLCRIALNDRRTHADARALQLANASSRGLLKPLAQEYGIPPVIKVDLVQDGEGNYFIAEVDTYNPRGLGYAALLEGSLPKEEAFARFPGMEGLAGLLVSVGAASNIPWHIVVSDFERYYETSYGMLQRALEKYGIKFRIVSESEIDSVLGTRKDIAGVLIIPDTLNQAPQSRDKLLAHYKSTIVRTFYPPVAYLGSKAFLPYLRTYPGLCEFIPNTKLVGRHYALKERDVAGLKVLKAAVSSGMKDVIFSDIDSGLFQEKLAVAQTQKNASWILQDQVPQEPIPIVVFDEEGNRVTRDYYLRVIAHISAYGIIDLDITGRPDRKVHGAPDCIQLPTIFA